MSDSYTKEELIDAFRAYSSGPRMQTYLRYLMEGVAELNFKDADTLQGHDYGYFMWAAERDLLQKTIDDCKTKSTGINAILG